MRKPIILLMPWLMATPLLAQDSVVMQLTNGDQVKIEPYAVDTFQSSPTTQKIQISYPNTDLQSFSYEPTLQESEINLQAADKAQSDNLLLSVSLLKSENSVLQYDIHIDALNKRELKAVVSPGVELSAIRLGLRASAAFIYVNGKRWSEDAKVDLSKKSEIKLVAYNGDVRTYTLELISPSNPTFAIKTKESVGLDWTSVSSMKIDSKEYSDVSIKGSGKHFSEGLKNSYRIKFESKNALLEMTKNKRWVLSSLDGDQSMMRVALAYDLSAILSELAWTPNYRRVDFYLNDVYMGHYLLVEQIRVCKGRLEDGYAISIQDAYDEGEDFFYGEKSNSLFVIKDPETGLNGAGLLRTKDKINLFEKSLFSNGDYSSLIDLQSFVDYYLLNEIAKDEDAFVSDCYMNVREDGLIAMGPVWNLGKSFGASGVSAEGFIANRSPWFEQLTKDATFMGLVKKRFAEMYAKKAQLLQSLEEKSAEMQTSVAYNNGVWKTLNVQSDDMSVIQESYQMEIAKLKQWLADRLEWMKSQLD